jgi:hypothetical protein
VLNWLRCHTRPAFGAERIARAQWKSTVGTEAGHLKTLPGIRRQEELRKPPRKQLKIFRDA